MSMIWKDRAVTVTGGAGFIGSNLARRLLNLGARVRLVDNLERGDRRYLADLPTNYEFRELDLRDSAAAEEAIRGSETVFHLACKVAGIKVYLEHPGSVLHQSLLIDQHVFAAVLKHQVRSVFYASTTHVYPEALQQTPDARPLREADAMPASPGLSYGWAKLVGEQTLLGLARENPWLRVAIARICGAYGCNQDLGLETGSVIPVFCHRAARWPELRPFRIWGTGAETRSYCFVEDVIDAMLLSIEALDTAQVVGPFNLGAEGRVTIREIAENVRRVAGKDIEFEFDPTAKTTIWGQAVDCALARELLHGWRPSTDLATGIGRVYAHVQQRLKENR